MYAVRRRRTRLRAIPLALTKISRIERLPFFPTHGALRTRALWARVEHRYELSVPVDFYLKTQSSTDKLSQGQ